MSFYIFLRGVGDFSVSGLWLYDKNYYWVMYGLLGLLFLFVGLIVV